MAKQTINAGETGAVVRGKLNGNFTELYDSNASYNSLSANWQNTYTNVQTNSASWALDSTEDSQVRALTAKYENTSTVVQTNSASWDYQGTDLKSLSANWQNTYTNVQTNSATTWNNLVSVRFSHQSFGPGDGNTNYISDVNDLAPLLNNTSRCVVAPVNGVVTRVTRALVVSGTVGTSEPAEFAIHNITASVSALITNNLLFDSAARHEAFTLSTPLSVSFGDLLALRQTYPGFATNPTAVRQTFNVIISQRP